MPSYNAENFGLKDIFFACKKMTVAERLAFFSSEHDRISRDERTLYRRQIVSPQGRTAAVLDPGSGQVVEMLMCGSNNYLGLADHPHVAAEIARLIGEYGSGIGGPPLLNGYTSAHRLLEERLSALKGTESCLLFSSGYSANLALASAIANEDDFLFYDEYCHASFFDGLQLRFGRRKARARSFAHNDMEHLEKLLSECEVEKGQSIFVAVEGVYSMDGDLAPLPRIMELCGRYGAFCLLDDAHGTGVLGPKGQGSPHHYGLEGKIDAVMGTFSKAFAQVGGFIAGSRSLVTYLRFFARSYMFSASLPVSVVAAVLAGLDVIEREPERLERLTANVARLNELFLGAGLIKEPSPSPIFCVIVPSGVDIRQAAHRIHQLGVFVNSIEYPAVSTDKQRFRVSISSEHSLADLDRVCETLATVLGDSNRHG